MVPLDWHGAMASWLLDQGCWSDTDGLFWELPRARSADAMPATKLPTSVVFMDADGVILTVVDVQAGERYAGLLSDGTRYVLVVRQGIIASHAVNVGDHVYAYASDHDLVPLKKRPMGG
jgi:uncharacterized membrane protein (UPF0127 family)